VYSSLIDRIQSSIAGVACPKMAVYVIFPLIQQVKFALDCEEWEVVDGEPLPIEVERSEIDL
jgi:hypothetical protein